MSSPDPERAREAVASGHGHDAIGFDLDPRNEDLARDRVGPLLWQEA